MSRVTFPPPTVALDAVVSEPLAPSAPSPAPARPAAGLGHEVDRLESAPKRTGTELLLGNPYADSLMHSAAYAALPSAMNAGLEALAKRYPEVDRAFAGRFLQTALSVGVQVPWMTYSHEAGHFREAKKQGGDPKIEMTGWMSGGTYFNFPDGKRPDGAGRSILSSAGVNQEQLNAIYMFQKWARNGGTNPFEAMGYLLAQTNLALYSSMTAYYEERGVPIPRSNDVRSYLDHLQKNGQALTAGQLAAMALATDLVSAPLWASLVGQLRYLATGVRKIEVPTVELGDVKSTFPNTHMLLTPDGPVLGASVVLDPDRDVPVELRLDVRTDLRAVAAGAKLYDVKLTGAVSVNPFLRGTIDGGRFGVLVGAEARAELGKGVALTGSVAFRHDDLLARPEGRDNGITAQVGIAFPF